MGLKQKFDNSFLGFVLYLARKVSTYNPDILSEAKYKIRLMENIYLIFALRLVIAAFVFLLIIFVFFILNEAISDAPTTPKKLIQYALVGVGGAIAYDCAKRIMYSSKDQFKKLCAHFLGSLLGFLIAFGLPIVASLSYYNDFPDWVSTILILVSFAWIWPTVNRVESAIESLRDTPNEADEIKTSK